MRLAETLGHCQAVKGQLPEPSGAWEGSSGTGTTSRWMYLIQVQIENRKLCSLCDFKMIFEEVRHSYGSDEKNIKWADLQSLDSLLMSSSISSPCLPRWVTTSLLIAPGPFQCVFMQIKANVNLSTYLPLSHKRYHLSRCHSLPDFCHVAIPSRYLLTQYTYFFRTAAW